MTPGKRLEQARNSLGLTQADMSARMGLPLRTYNRYALGERPPSAEALEALARLGFNVNWILTGNGPMRVQELADKPGFAQPNVDEELNARVFEAVAAAYVDCGLPLSARDQGRAAAQMYNEIAGAGLESWDEKMGALRLAAGQLRRRLLLSMEQGDTGQTKHSA